MDIEILYFINAHFCCDFLTAVMKLFTLLSNHAEIWLATIIALIFIKQPYLNDNHKSFFLKKYRIYALLMIIAIVLVVLLTEGAIKHIIKRPRPFVEYPDITLLIPAPSGYSFPSSHSATSFACAFMLLMMNKKVGIFAYIVATIVAFSRMYFMVHFPTDVLAGILIGTAVAVFVYFVAKHLLKKKMCITI